MAYKIRILKSIRAKSHLRNEKKILLLRDQNTIEVRHRGVSEFLTSTAKTLTANTKEQHLEGLHQINLIGALT